MNSKSFAIPALLATLATAQSAPPPIPIELRARFGFTGPLVHKVGFGIHSLKIGDINGDGRLEAVVFDGRRARLVAVGVVDGETTNTTIPTGGQIASVSPSRSVPRPRSSGSRYTPFTSTRWALALGTRNRSMTS